MEWSEESAIELMKCYQTYPILWDPTIDKTRRNRDARINALLEIADKFNTTKREVERKLKNLISHFARELKKEKFERVGKKKLPYRSRWYGYRSMEFLSGRLKREHLESETSTSLPKPAVARTSIAASSSKSESNIKPTTMIEIPSLVKNVSPSCSTPQASLAANSTPHVPIRPKLPTQSISQPQAFAAREKHVCSSSPCIAAQESEYDRIAKAWASELQKMAPEQQIYAKRAIAEIMFEGQLGGLHRDSIVINRQPNPESASAPAEPSYIIEKMEPDFDC